MKKLFFILFFALPIVSNAQARKVWLYHADNFFEKEDYHNALINYQKALSDSVGIESLTIPYDVDIAKLKIKDKELEIEGSEAYVDAKYAELKEEIVSSLLTLTSFFRLPNILA